MNVNKNSYTIGFACVMVVFVAALLASMSIQLTPLQDRNIELEKKPVSYTHLTLPTILLV